jgi:hypothetical protein
MPQSGKMTTMGELSALCAGEPSVEKSGRVPLETRMILKETSKGQVG